MKPLSSHPKGFTLLELLLTLSLFALVMTLLTNGYFEFHKSDQRLKEEMELSQEARALEMLLTEDFLNARYLKSYIQNKEGQDNITGILATHELQGEDHFSKVSMHVEGESRFFRGLEQGLDPEYHEVGYQLVNESGEVKFYRREEFYLDESLEPGVEAQRQLLSSNVKSFYLQFKGDTEVMEEQWSSSAASPFPKAVVVTLGLQNQQGRKLIKSFTVNFFPTLGDSIEWAL